MDLSQFNRAAFKAIDKQSQLEYVYVCDDEMQTVTILEVSVSPIEVNRFGPVCFPHHKSTARDFFNHLHSLVSQSSPGIEFLGFVDPNTFEKI